MMMEAETGRRVGKNTIVLETFIEGQVNLFGLVLSRVPCPLACSGSFLFFWGRCLSVPTRMSLVDVLARLTYVCSSSLGLNTFGPFFFNKIPRRFICISNLSHRCVCVRGWGVVMVPGQRRRRTAGVLLYRFSSYFFETRLLTDSGPRLTGESLHGYYRLMWPHPTFNAGAGI